MDTVISEKKKEVSVCYESKPNESLKTMADIVAYRAMSQPEKEAFTYLIDGEDERVSWTYEDLKNAVAHAARALDQNVQAGDRVLLLFEPGLSFIAAYLATIGSGAVAVPCHPPAGKRQVKRLLDMMQDCQPMVVFHSTSLAQTPPQLTQLSTIAEQVGVRMVAVDIPVNPSPDEWLRSEIREKDLAMLQYTSASTGEPKGVMVTQENIVKNCEAIYRWLGPHSARKGSIWLPPYHDMGLLGGIMQPLYAGFPLVFMSPLHFIQRPLRWLKTLSDFELTTTGAPNFALQLCVDEISEEELEAAQLDLSRVREIFCGSEPINPATVHAFEQRFSPYGLPDTALNPCYGLAEATLFVTGKPARTRRVTGAFDASAMDLGVVKAVTEEAEGRTLMSCGVAGNELNVTIVDPQTAAPSAPNTVGEVWITGPSVAQGYWRNQDLTASAFHNALAESGSRFYRTGDLGFIHNGELYITGRIKEVIIIRGRNLYPQDIERCALNASALLSSASAVAAAFSVVGQDTEQLVVVIAVRRRLTVKQQSELQQAVTAAIQGEFNVAPSCIHIGPISAVPRTTSGKIQRNACRQAYLSNSLPAFAPDRKGGLA